MGAALLRGKVSWFERSADRFLCSFVGLQRGLVSGENLEGLRISVLEGVIVEKVKDFFEDLILGFMLVMVLNCV